MPEILPSSDVDACTAEAVLTNDAGVLCCWLAAGHENPHYDRVDDLSWTKGQPGA